MNDKQKTISERLKAAIIQSIKHGLKSAAKDDTTEEYYRSLKQKDEGQSE